jgi:hypothetical protein
MVRYYLAPTLAARRVESRSRFIEEEDLRGANESYGRREASLLTT